MHGSYRRIVLAAVGWLILAGADYPAEQRERTEASAKAGPSQASIAATTPTPTPTATYTPYPHRYAESCYTAPDHDTADLCAQWRAAIAAEKAAQEAGRATTWAAVATILSAIGVGGLIYTIWQTQGALGEARRSNLIAQRANARSTRQAIAGAEDTKKAIAVAKRSADAAKELAKIADRTARQQLRAYVAIGRIKVKGIEIGETPRVNVSVANKGQTPAIVKRFVLALGVASSDFAKDPALPDVEDIDGTKAQIGGGQTMLSVCEMLGALNEADRNRLLDKTDVLYIWGYCIYADIFEEEHRMFFRASYDPWVRRNMMHFTPAGNQAD